MRTLILAVLLLLTVPLAFVPVSAFEVIDNGPGERQDYFEDFNNGIGGQFPYWVPDGFDAPGLVSQYLPTGGFGGSGAWWVVEDGAPTAGQQWYEAAFGDFCQAGSVQFQFLVDDLDNGGLLTVGIYDQALFELLIGVTIEPTLPGVTNNFLTINGEAWAGSGTPTQQVTATEIYSEDSWYTVVIDQISCSPVSARIRIIETGEVLMMNTGETYTAGDDFNLFMVEGVVTDPQEGIIIDNILLADWAEPDVDGDGVNDDVDNCPTVSNVNQADLDGDGQGDVCDNDDDGDNVNDGADNCPLVANPGQADSDQDGIGDACEGDSDQDGVLDDVDNCPNDFNSDQADADGDGLGDVCDPYPQFDGDPYAGDGSGTGFPEDFEDDTVGQNPQQDAYTWVVEINGGGDAVVSADVAYSGIKSLHLNPTGGSLLERMDLNVPATAPASYSFAVFPTDCGLVGGDEDHNIGVGIGNVAENDGFHVGINSDCQVIIADDRIGEVSAVGPLLQADVWHTVSVSIDWPMDSVSVDVDGSFAVEQTDAALAFVSENVDHIYFVAGDLVDSQMYVDDVSFADAPPPVGTGFEEADETAVFTGIVGFDVDVSGSWGIIRTDGGATVQTFPATTLVGGANTIDSNCARVDGVAALPDHVTFLKCEDGDPSTVESFNIRAGNLGSPDKGDGCAGFCVDEIQVAGIGGELAGDQQDNREIGDVAGYPFDYSEVREPAGGSVRHVHMAWAFSTTEGEIGVVTYTHIANPVQDNSAIEFRAIGNQAVTQLASCHSKTDGDDYLYGAAASGAIKGYRVVFQETKSSNRAVLEVALENLALDSGMTSNGNGVSCGGDRLIISRTVGAFEQVRAFERDASGVHQEIWTHDGLAVPDRGVFMSGDGAFAGYINGSQVVFVDAATGDVLDDVRAKPVGTFLDGRMTLTGSAAWIATDSRVGYYNIQAATGAEAPDPGDYYDAFPGDGPTDGFNPENAGAFGGLVVNAEGFLGEGGAQIFAMSLFVFGFAAVGSGTGFGVARSRDWDGGGAATAGAVLGAAIGFVFPVAMGLIAREWAFLVALFIVLALGVFAFIRSR